MPRTIKFRAWLPRAKKMFVVSDLDCMRNPPYHFTIFERWEDWGEGGKIPVSGSTINRKGEPDFVLMQYTGLKDKNGKEIYEGDVVECPRDSIEPGIFEVRYREKDAAFLLYSATNKGFFYWEDVVGGEVIGNIYEDAAKWR